MKYLLTAFVCFAAASNGNNLNTGSEKRFLFSSSRHCDVLPRVNHGYFHCAIGSPRYAVKGEVCHLLCHSPYTPAAGISNTITCAGNDRWTGHVACTDATCSTVPVVSNGHFTCPTSPGGRHSKGDTCHLVCNNGYTPSPGNNAITCGDNKQWTGHAVCSDNHCPAPANIASGTFVCPLSRVYGSICQLYCSAGHMVRGPAQITCQNTKQWTQSGSCTAVQCPSPPAVENGKYSCPNTSYTHGETCLLECNKGFHPATHHLNITCQTDETWSAATSCIDGCPQGTFTNTTSSGDKFCQHCPMGTYQNGEKSLTCIPCPAGWSTGTEGSVDVGACTSMCRPGTVSSSGLEPCHLCPMGSYQNQTGGNTCEPCPGGHTTSNVGSSLTEHCVPL